MCAWLAWVLADTDCRATDPAVLGVPDMVPVLAADASTDRAEPVVVR